MIGTRTVRLAWAVSAAIVFFGTPLSAQDTDNLARVQGMLGTPDVLCGTFEQSKTLVGLRKPVMSGGRFCVVADRGVLWRTLRPFPATLRLTRNEITEYSGDQVSKHLSAEQEPSVRMITDLLFSVLAGELSRLASTFDIVAKVGAADWQATLTPRDAGMKRAIGRIEMQGGAYVGHIVIHEAAGDRTDITFSSVSTGKGAMLPEEAKLIAR